MLPHCMLVTYERCNYCILNVDILMTFHDVISPNLLWFCPPKNYVTSWDAHTVLCIITRIMWFIFYESDHSLCKVGWKVTLYDVNTLLHAYKQIIISMREVHTKWYAMFRLACVVLVKHNTIKLCAISLNTKARLHIMLYIKQATYKDNVVRKYTRTNNLQGYLTLPPAQWGGPIPRIISNIPSCLA